MPAMTGYDVLERIQQDAALRDIPVVMLTAHVQQESDVLYGLRNGAVDHLAKPFRGPILAAKIQSLVERRSRQLLLEERLRTAEAQATTLEDQFAELDDSTDDAEVEARLAALKNSSA